MSDEDTELRDLVMQTLEVNGTLSKIRAQLRANVFLALEEQDSVQNKTPLLNKGLKQFLCTKEGKLVGGLIREFLEFFDLDSSLAVFEPESGLDPDCPRRNALAKELNVHDDADTSKNPLLLAVFKQKKNTPIETFKETTNSYSELTDKQIKDAREQFEIYDKDCNNSIDKDELRDLFMDMFPNFHRNMLDLYVNDEFKSMDKDFSNSIEFEEFLGMYKRLFILCQSVVSCDTIKPTATKIKIDLLSSPLSSKSESISERKDMNNGPKSFIIKHGSKPDINDILGSDMDDDSFFDDSPPNDSGLKNFNSTKHSECGRCWSGSCVSKIPVFSPLRSTKPSESGRLGSGNRPSQIPVFSPLRRESKDKSSKTNDNKESGDLFLKDAPPLQSKPDKNLRPVDKRLIEFSLEGDDIEYEDDFDASGHSLSQKSPRVNSRSDIKSVNENGSMAEEIEEDIEDFSIEEGDLKSGMDDFTTDCSISQADRGFDYAEDLQLP